MHTVRLPGLAPRHAAALAVLAHLSRKVVSSPRSGAKKRSKSKSISGGAPRGHQQNEGIKLGHEDGACAGSRLAPPRGVDKKSEPPPRRIIPLAMWARSVSRAVHETLVAVRSSL